ncbi:MAG: hypothetical protein RIR70_1410 [Pseudomonadota bacterium]|jgi:ribosomal subunit interface protein
MQVPLQTVYRDIDRSPAIDADVEEKAAKLELFFPRITSCRVTLGMIQRHKHQGKLFNVRVDVRIPGHEIVVNRDRAEDIYVALRDAFDHMKRQLEDYSRKMRGDVKTHEPEQIGKVVEIYPEEGFGFIEKSDGAHVYFHRFNLQRPDFEVLREGDEVVFLEEPATQGTQANRVRARA